METIKLSSKSELILLCCSLVSACIQYLYFIKLVQVVSCTDTVDLQGMIFTGPYRENSLEMLASPV
jgi:hypothetical protein